MHLSEIQKRLDQQNQILNAWLALNVALECAEVEDKNFLTINMVRSNINRVCVAIDGLQIEHRKQELAAIGLSIETLI